MRSGDGALARLPLVAAGCTVNGCSRADQSWRTSAANVPSSSLFRVFFPNWATCPSLPPSPSPPPSESFRDHLRSLIVRIDMSTMIARLIVIENDHVGLSLFWKREKEREKDHLWDAPSARILCKKEPQLALLLQNYILQTPAIYNGAYAWMRFHPRDEGPYS